MILHKIIIVAANRSLTSSAAHSTRDRATLRRAQDVYFIFVLFRHRAVLNNNNKNAPLPYKQWFLHGTACDDERRLYNIIILYFILTRARTRVYILFVVDTQWHTAHNDGALE